MRSVRRSRLIAIALMTLSLSSCSRYYFNMYRSEISANQQSLQRLQLGMTTAEVLAVMGEGETVRYRAIHLVDPWRSEAFTLADGTKVRVVHYVTQPPRRFDPPTDREVTPIVIENDEVVGWGWSFLRQNLDRYQIAAPKDLS